MSGEEVLYAQFNQDYSSLSLGTEKGWSVVQSLTTMDKLMKNHEAAIPEGVKIVERLFSSSLVAIVAFQCPRKLRVVHFAKGHDICNFSYPNSILAVKLNRARLVVGLEDMLYIHNIRDMKILHTIRDTPPNGKGVVALCVNADNSFLAYPGSASTGEVQVFDAFNLQSKIVIHAHASPLAAMVFNFEGTYLATASEKGTVIRVFNTADGSRLFEFRRGVKRCVDTYCMAFSPDSTLLAMCSNTETIHIFQLRNQPEDREETSSASNSWMEWVKSTLPTQVTEVWTQDRAFATITLPFHEKRSAVAIMNTNERNSTPMTQVQVASYDGYLYIYKLPPLGGECELLKQYKLSGDSDIKKSSQSSPPGAASYAGVVKGHSPKTMSDADKISEISNALDPTLDPSSSDSDYPGLE